jgi:hypothetical protein
LVNGFKFSTVTEFVDAVATTAPLLLSSTVYNCIGSVVLPGVNVISAAGFGEMLVAVTLANTAVGALGTE